MQETIRLAGLTKSIDDRYQDVTIGAYLEQIARFRCDHEKHEAYYGLPKMSESEFVFILSMENNELSAGTLSIVE